MFQYDPDIPAVLDTTPRTIPEVVATMSAIDDLCVNEDGLKWFNGLYLQRVSG